VEAAVTVVEAAGMPAAEAIQAAAAEAVISSS
jgi:hypothetical protein